MSIDNEMILSIEYRSYITILKELKGIKRNFKGMSTAIEPLNFFIIVIYYL